MSGSSKYTSLIWSQAPPKLTSRCTTQPQISIPPVLVKEEDVTVKLEVDEEPYDEIKNQICGSEEHFLISTQGKAKQRNKSWMKARKRFSVESKRWPNFVCLLCVPAKYCGFRLNEFSLHQTETHARNGFYHCPFCSRPFTCNGSRLVNHHIETQHSDLVQWPTTDINDDPNFKCYRNGIRPTGKESDEEDSEGASVLKFQLITDESMKNSIKSSLQFEKEKKAVGATVSLRESNLSSNESSSVSKTISNVFSKKVNTNLQASRILSRSRNWAGKYECSICLPPVYFDYSLKDYQSHLRIHRMGGNYFCPHCPFITQRKDVNPCRRLRCHVRFHHFRSPSSSSAEEESETTELDYEDTQSGITVVKIEHVDNDETVSEELILPD